MRTARRTLLITRRLPDAVIDRASRCYDLHGNPNDQHWTPQILVEQTRSAGAKLILCTPTDQLDAEGLASLPDHVEMIATYSVGVDHIDLAAAQTHGIVVTNTPDVLTGATADIAMLCLLGAARYASAAQRDLREGRWNRWTPTAYLGLELEGATLGIVGMGRIGRATARRAQGFGMRIAYWNRAFVADTLLSREGVTADYVADLDELFASCDAISLHVPETPETRGIVDARRLSLMPSHAILVNTARGGLVDDAALIAALTKRRIAGAGLDVFAGEPALHPGYLTAPNAYLLPHIGSATLRTRDAMGFRALDNLDAFVSGREPPDRVV